MEPFATKILLRRLHKKHLDIQVITTDRSTQLKALLKEINQIRIAKNLPPIKHSYDVWHLVKSVTKDLGTASKLKSCETLGIWIKSIRRMMYYAFANCQGNPLLLREMILSIPRHVSGVHNFPENQLFKKCLHAELDSERDKPWLREGSPSMKKLVMAIRGNKDSRLKDLEMMTEYQHTSTNESVNALHNVYLSKSYAFDHPQAIVRACLTGIDHNKNANRSPRLDQYGEQMYSVRYTRDGQEYTAREVLQAKDTSWRKEIFSEVLQAMRSAEVLNITIPTDDHLKRYNRKRPLPDKSVAVEATKKRRLLMDQPQEQNTK